MQFEHVKQLDVNKFSRNLGRVELEDLHGRPVLSQLRLQRLQVLLILSNGFFDFLGACLTHLGELRLVIVIFLCLFLLLVASLFPGLHLFIFLGLDLGRAHFFVISFIELLQLLLLGLLASVDSLFLAFGELSFKHIFERLFVIGIIPANRSILLALENYDDFGHAASVLEKVRNNVFDFGSLSSVSTFFIKAKVVLDRGAPVTIHDQTLFGVDDLAKILDVLFAFFEVLRVVHDLLVDLRRRIRVLRLWHAPKTTLEETLSLPGLQLLFLLLVEAFLKLEGLQFELLAKHVDLRGHTGALSTSEHDLRRRGRNGKLGALLL
mmetsp:Transcript_10866/g.13703  ORF Transcript_10866/g.13703 Transcript_10866/m.13703 type:complete len:322 (+) Transcript_10866:2026-2991(+)